MPTILHQIRKGAGPTISGKLPLTPYPIGTPLMIASIDPATGAKTFALADGRADGFMTRDSRANPGLTDTEQLFGFGIETPFFAGFEGSIEPGEHVEVEGSQYIDASITANTAIDTDLTFAAGKFKAPTTGQVAQYRLKAIMTAKVAGNVRILVVAIHGYKA